MDEIDFIRESNRIEGIYRDPTPEEVNEFDRFMKLDVITVDELNKFVSVYQPDAQLRDKKGLDVRIGNHIPPKGGPDIRIKLEELLKNANPINSFSTHIKYEKLHPFTDGNGRSGRMLWAWQYGDLSLGFLHRFYYQTLENFAQSKE